MIDHPYSLHDFALAPAHLICYLSPYVLDVGKMIAEGTGVMEALTWRPELGSTLLVADRGSGDHLPTVPIGDAYCLHLINAHEDGAHLVVDMIELDRPVYDQYWLHRLFTEAPAGRPSRLTVDVASNRLIDRRQLDYTALQDFPVIAPNDRGRGYDDFWVLGISKTGMPGRKFFDQLARLSWQGTAPHVYQAPANCYLGGEPIFIPHPAHRDMGVTICQCFDATDRTSSFLLFDSFNVAAGPIATLSLERRMPLCFHACFAAGTSA